MQSRETGQLVMLFVLWGVYMHAATISIAVMEILAKRIFNNNSLRVKHRKCIDYMQW